MSSARLLRELTRQLVEQSRHRLPESPPDLSAYAFADVEAARLQWLNRVVQEHRSVVDYADLLALLADIDAPYDVLCALERVLSDEMRHVVYCRQVVTWLGGSDDIELDLTGFRRRERSDEPRLVHAILRVTEELFIAEEASLLIQKAYLQACTEPTIKAVLRMLLEDEGVHTAIGKAIQEQLLATVTEDQRDAVAERVKQHEQSVRQGMHILHRAAARNGPGRELGGCVTAEDLDGLAASKAGRALDATNAAHGGGSGSARS